MRKWNTRWNFGSFHKYIPHIELSTSASILPIAPIGLVPRDTSANVPSFALLECSTTIIREIRTGSRVI